MMKKHWKPCTRNFTLLYGLSLAAVLTLALNAGLAVLIDCGLVTMKTALGMLPIIPTVAVWAGGFLTARKANRQKLLWSICCGLCYFGLLTVLHLMFFSGAYQNGIQLFAIVLSISTVSGLCGAGISREKKLAKACRMH